MTIILQEDFNRLHEGLDKWYIGFILDNTKYFLMNIEICNSNYERNLGVPVSKYLKPRQLCIAIRKISYYNRLVGFSSSTVSNRTEDMIDPRANTTTFYSQHHHIPGPTPPESTPPTPEPDIPQHNLSAVACTNSN